MDPRWHDREWADGLLGVDFLLLEYNPDTGQYCFEGRPFTGVSKTRFPDGRLAGLGHHRDGVEEGVSVGWYADGRLECYSEMADDVYHGTHYEWDENGKLVVAERYENGTLQG